MPGAHWDQITEFDGGGRNHLVGCGESNATKLFRSWESELSRNAESPSQQDSSTSEHVDLGARRAETPLLARDDYSAPSVFRPENMLREARRQRGIRRGQVPRVCLLDPDGDMVRFVKLLPGARRTDTWACYHTDMWEWDASFARLGIVGSAVGGAFAVLVAEQLFASGCGLLVSISSAGRIAEDLKAPRHLLLERALRDEGTSHHYIPPSTYVAADPSLAALAMSAFAAAGRDVKSGDTWTTDAPFRETAATISARRHAGIQTVEMEAASLYAFGAARAWPVLCLAHLTNDLGCVEGDFDKGEHDGACSSLELFGLVAEAWLKTEVLAATPGG